MDLYRQVLILAVVGILGMAICGLSSSKSIRLRRVSMFVAAILLSVSFGGGLVYLFKGDHHPFDLGLVFSMVSSLVIIFGLAYMAWCELTKKVNDGIKSLET